VTVVVRCLVVAAWLRCLPGPMMVGEMEQHRPYVAIVTSDCWRVAVCVRGSLQGPTGGVLVSQASMDKGGGQYIPYVCRVPQGVLGCALLGLVDRLARADKLKGTAMIDLLRLAEVPIALADCLCQGYWLTNRVVGGWRLCCVSECAVSGPEGT
jgi:hypothetical protein